MDKIFGKRISKKTRSLIMAKIKSSNTKLELIVFDFLKKQNIKFSSHGKMLGHPDLFSKKKKIAIFIDSDYWHGWKFKSWAHKLKPFWRQKIQNNIRRDINIRKKLRRQGWKVLRIWEHEIKNDKVQAFQKIIRLLKSP